MADPDGWERAAYGTRFRNEFGLGGEERLKRPPRGYDPDHPWIDDLRRKSFTASARVTQKQVTAPGFIEEYARLCTLGSPFVAFLCRAVGVPF